jgi:uncharacterized FAD-dependent dehydrogenase
METLKPVFNGVADVAEQAIDHELERRMKFARGIAARAWCADETKHIEMDHRLAEAFARILVYYMYQPHLGCATTDELLKEIRARIEVDGKLGYSTIPKLPERRKG